MSVDTAAAFARARAEVDAIDRELQDAYDRIIDAVERVVSAGESLPTEIAEGIDLAMTEILESSAVRDIAGQRLVAVKAAVDDAESGAAATEDTLERKRDKSSKIEEKQDHGSASESCLLNGPQLPGAARTQTEVDALFDKLD